MYRYSCLVVESVLTTPHFLFTMSKIDCALTTALSNVGIPPLLTMLAQTVISSRRKSSSPPAILAISHSALMHLLSDTLRVQTSHDTRQHAGMHSPQY